MKLVALCLLAVCYSALVHTKDVSTQIRKLQEVQKELKDVKDTFLKTEKMFNAPPQNIEDGCCLAALECFRDNLDPNITDKAQRKLFRSLRHQLTESSLSFCSSGNNTCQSSKLKVNGREFFTRLESLIQMAMNNLS